MLDAAIEDQLQAYLGKSKRMSVVGGGNSSVEAAIDLADIVGHVMLLEFASTLRTDEGLQRKLRSPLSRLRPLA
jgi:alkyl hydroperoxide reductase subunit AhpF